VCRRCGRRLKREKLEVAPYMADTHPDRWRCIDTEACEKARKKKLS
jgi:hypothetical protein